MRKDRIVYQLTQAGRINILLLVFHLLIPPLVAQQRLFTSQQHFGVEDGLPQSYISGIIQDDDGFIWMSTLDGLCRYDGRGFKTFRYKPNDSTSLAANTIYRLGSKINNTVTIYYSPSETDNFNLRTFKISRNTTPNLLSKIPNATWQTYVAKTGEYSIFLLADSKGIGWMKNATGKVYFANEANGLLQQDTISAMTQSPDGKVYLVSENGVRISDPDLKKFDLFPFYTGIKKQPATVFGDIYTEHYQIISLPGNKLAITDAGKLMIIDVLKKKIVSYPIPPNPSGTQANLSMLQVDTKGRIYFTDFGRVFRLTETGELKLLWENTTQPGLRISALFIDRSDVLWVSVNAQGILKIDLQAMPFESYGYKINFMSDIMERAYGKELVLPPSWKDEEGSYFFRQARYANGNVYACFNRYYNNKVYLVKDGNFSSLPHIPTETWFSTFLTTPNNELWVIDMRSPAWYKWKSPGAIPEKIQLDAESMKDIEPADAKYIGDYIWLSTYRHGLLQFKEGKRINQFKGMLPQGIMPEALTEICPDPVDKNKFWIGSRGGGLILWDVHKGLQHVYTMNDGLPNNTVYCILPDKQGKIWCSTNKGIFRFDRATKEIIAFEKTDGLPGNEFNRAHKFSFDDGQLAFGGLDGYTVFNPGDFVNKNKPTPMPVSLTGLQINNRPQDMNLPGTIVKQPLSTLSRIDLPYDNNNLRFEFAALLYNQPQKIKYRYQLKDADKDWIENGTNNIASYVGLRPGKYVLRINATNNNGLWSDIVKEIIIVIRPPFWATWWAYLVYALIGLGLLRWYFTFREKRMQAEQSLVFEKREALRLKETDEMKDRFFSNITHEFRTPLTLIITPLEKLAQDPSLSAGAVNTLQTIKRNSNQLLQLINEFLDFSKINNGQLKLKLSTGELALFTTACVRSFEARAKEKNIQLEFTTKDIEGFYLFDELKWEKIVNNLIGNALKFTPVGGKVLVLLSAGDTETIQLEVIDNGAGIPIDQQQKIFDRFYQVDDSAIRNVGGTGIGLSLVKELCTLMHGTIQVESKPGGPTRFIVNVPMQHLPGRKDSFIDAVPVKSEMNNTGEELPLLLVVEDNDELREFLAEAMGGHYRILQAADGLQAWDIILQELPDIIISDVMMPGQDGFDLCRKCKSDNRTAHICFILLTSKAAHDQRLKGLGVFADDYITKPFSLEELQLRTANLLYAQEKTRAWLQSQLISTAPGEKAPVIKDPFLLQLYKEMDAKLDDPELGVDYLCKTMAMSRSTLNRKLRSLLDISTNDLVRQYRLQKAARLLTSGSDITSVVYQVGFSSPSYFSQSFKEKYGITPTDYVSQGKLTQN